VDIPREKRTVIALTTSLACRPSPQSRLTGVDDHAREDLSEADVNKLRAYIDQKSPSK